MDAAKGSLSYLYAALATIITVFAEGLSYIEPSRVIWILGFSGALFGAAFFPSDHWFKTLVKLMFGSLIAGVASNPISSAHYMPAFMNANVTALWLGFAGPALFVAALEKKSIPWMKGTP